MLVTSELIARSGPLWNIGDRYGILMYFWAHSEESSWELLTLDILLGIILFIDGGRKLGKCMTLCKK